MKLDSVPGTEVAIHIDNEAVAEYGDHEDTRADGNVAICYIEAASGLNFSVHVKTNNARLQNPNDAVRYTIALDGKSVTSRNLKKFNLDGSARGQSIGVTDSIDGREMLARYKFADLHTNDEPSEALNVDQYKRLGEIEITMYVMRLVPKTGRRLGGRVARSALDTSVLGTISEKDLKGKAISQRATFGDLEALPKRRDRGSRHLPPGESVTYPYGRMPFATFIFKYRSQRDLQIEGVIPREASPTYLPWQDMPQAGAGYIPRNVLHHGPAPLAGIKDDININQSQSDRTEAIARPSDFVKTASQFLDPEIVKPEPRVEQHKMEIIDLTSDD